MLIATAYSFIQPKYIIIFEIKTITMTMLLPKSVSQGFDRYNKITLTDNITLLPMPHGEDQDIVMSRVTEKEIEEASSKKKYIKKKRPKRRRTYRPILK